MNVVVLKSTCYVNLLSKLSIIGIESYCSLCTLDTMHRLFFVTRSIINQINKVQWVDFKLENVLVSLHSFGASAPLFLRNGVTRTFSYTYSAEKLFMYSTGNLQLNHPIDDCHCYCGEYITQF
jgi:hypothetical protein